ncbi:MAG: amino acid adenylation domain-containing protein [Azoarcus sp.]|jgi:amino acid adenylation domain-containing protein|nr:amino acid adenylation domain-containing protein [Azoarcus sp.]
MNDISRVDEYRLSAQQCAAHLAAPERTSPSIVILLEGPASEIDVGAVRAALEREVARNEILRTRYRTVPDVRYPVQQVLAHLSPAWKVIEGPVDDAILTDAARGLIDAYAGAVVASVVSVSDGRMRWALAAAQISLDFFSTQTLAIACLNACRVAASAVGALDGALQSDEPPQPNELLQYADYAAWQDELFGSGLGEEGAQFWEAKLLEQVEPPQLPFRRSTPLVNQITVIETVLPGVDALSGLAAHCGTSIETTLLALWIAYLARIAQSDVLSFAWVCGDRSPEIQGAIGNYATLLPAVARLDEGASTTQHITTIAGQLKEIAEWSECFDVARYFERVARDGIPVAAVAYEYVKLEALPTGWTWRAVDVSPGVAWLKCLCVVYQTSVSMKWISNGHFAPEALQVFGRQFATFVESAVAGPQLRWSEISLLSEPERKNVFDIAGIGTNHKRESYSVARLHELFELAAARYPERLAVVGEGGSLCYRDLDVRANHLAQRLRAIGAKPGMVVGVYIGRSVHAIAAMLAVLKVGAAYVPIDPDYPKERVDFMLRDAGIPILIALSADLAGLSEQGRQVVAADASFEGRPSRPAVDVPLDALAYIIYTSGSTGQPKGVMVSHRNAVASTLARREFYAEPVRNYLLLSSFSFDSSVAGIFWTLTQGGTLHLPMLIEYNDPELLAQKIEKAAISHVLTLPSFYQQILQYLHNPASLRCAIVAGEACHAEVVASHRQSAQVAELVNEYGPTEGTVWSNAFRVRPEHAVEDGIPIGRPISTMRALILDADLNLCPIGMAGELFIGGAGVTGGYLHRPGLTAQRYVADPLAPGGRLYRTGDRARYRPDGEIDCLGRIDRQVKLRGHRIELAEIEDCLVRHPAVQEAAVLLQEDTATGGRIVAYVSALSRGADAGGADAAGESILAFARDRLPAIMVPVAISVSSELPRLPNGKIDRNALSTLAYAYHRPPFVAPTSVVEQVLANIWQAVLKVDRVGLDDDFFALGGHSLLATQVVAKIRQELSVDLPVQDVFTSTRLRDLAAKIDEGMDALTRDLTLFERISAEVGA